MTKTTAAKDLVEHSTPTVVNTAPSNPPTAKKTAAPKKPAAEKSAAPKSMAAKPAASNAVAPKKPVVKAAKIKTTQAVAKPIVSKSVAPLKEKAKKARLVRDSFSMPEAEYAVLGMVKKACLKAGIEVKKSELLRIGVALIQKMDVAALKGVLSTLQPLKAGRPKQDK